LANLVLLALLDPLVLLVNLDRTARKEWQAMEFPVLQE